MRVGILAASAALAASALATSLAPTAAGASQPVVWVYAGTKLWVDYANSPLRQCPDTSCTVMAWMPESTSSNPGGGYVTSAVTQAYEIGYSFAPWCEINWKGVVGWTGCWRLGPALA